MLHVWKMPRADRVWALAKGMTPVNATVAKKFREGADPEQ